MLGMVTPMPNIIDILKQDHEKVALLFQQGEEAVDELLTAIRLHDRIEAELVYPEARAAGLDLAKAEDDHAKVRALLDAIEAGDLSLFEKLHKEMELHVYEEEHQILPQIEERIPVERLETLGEEAEQLRGA